MKASGGTSTRADVLHPLLAGLLLLEQLALAGDVTAVALGQDVLADRADVLAGDDPRADGGLDRHLELLPRDEFLELAGHHHAVAVGLVLVDDRRERVDGSPWSRMSTLTRSATWSPSGS
jgi:hypothetical protein